MSRSGQSDQRRLMLLPGLDEFFRTACERERIRRWRTLPALARYDEAMAALNRVDGRIDLVESMRMWLERRRMKWQANQAQEAHART